MSRPEGSGPFSDDFHAFRTIRPSPAIHSRLPTFHFPALPRPGGLGVGPELVEGQSPRIVIKSAQVLILFKPGEVPIYFAPSLPPI